MRRNIRAYLTAAVLFSTASHTAHAAQIITQDFNGPGAWPQLSSSVSPSGKMAHVQAELSLIGTIDVADSTTPSGAALLSVSHAAQGGSWSAGLSSGLLPVTNKETNLGKLTLSFDHSVSSVRPVTVQIESFDANKKRTGGLQSMVYPAADDFYLRAAIDLSTMQAFGTGKFRPTDPFIKITYYISRLPDGAKETEDVQLRIDNVAYAPPTFYVSPQGNDTNDGRTEKTAFADPQKAVNAAQPGDIILLMDGTYHRAPTTSIHQGIIGFTSGGTPAAWIVVKNYPGQHPVLTSDAWNTIKIGREVDQSPTSPTLAYLEVRGLHIRGMGDTIRTTHPELIGKADSLTNGNGISGSSSHEVVTPHHLRFADNLVEYCAGGGIGGSDCDWMTIENNTIRNNCWTTIYATSGISIGARRHFDAVENVYKTLIRNNVLSGNRCYEKWKQVGRLSDGNGIIVDTNYVPAKKLASLGRILIQNNLTFNNGGSGIHVFRGHRVDIINNTAYYNGATPELGWGQIFVQIGDDITMRNNILVSRPDQPINSVGSNGNDQNSTNIIRGSNIYFGGLPPKLTGDGDIVTDPQFVNPSVEENVADFHARPGSPALKSGWQGPLVPLRDLDNKPRPAASAPDRGAYQK